MGGWVGMGFVMGFREKSSWDCARFYQMFRGGTKVGRGRDRDGLGRHRNGITGGGGVQLFP